MCAHMNTFKFALERRRLDREMLPFLMTFEEMDVFLAIGAEHDSENPLTVKLLCLMGIAPERTVLRIVQRLCDARVVLRKHAWHDRRIKYLCIHKRYVTRFNRHQQSMKASFC